jgi:RNA polymerase sigma-70 factor (ECF subfamily)
MMTPRQELHRKAVFAAAHHEYQKGLNSHAFFKLRSHATSDDLVQDTFIKTWSYLVKGGEIETMKAFLYHILNNLIVDEYRKRKTISLDVLFEKGFEPGSDHSEQLVNILDGKTAILLIEKLPEKYRDALHMRYVQDLSLAEMASITGKTKNSIAVQVYRGLEKLKALYAHA